MATGKQTCTIVTLIRGRSFSLTDPRDSNTAFMFERNVPKALPQGKEYIADYLNDEVDVATDDDGQEFEKPKFKIQYDSPIVKATSVNVGKNGKKRIRLKPPGSDTEESTPRPAVARRPIRK